MIFIFFWFLFSLIGSSKQASDFTSYDLSRIPKIISSKRQFISKLSTLSLHNVQMSNIVFENLRENGDGGAFFIQDRSLNLFLKHVTFFNCQAYQCGGGIFEGKDAYLTEICASNIRGMFIQFMYINNTLMNYRTEINQSTVFRCCPNETRTTDNGGFCAFIGSILNSYVNQSQNCMKGGPSCFLYQTNDLLIQYCSFTSCYGELHGFIHPAKESYPNRTAVYDHLNFCNHTYYGRKENSMLHTHRLPLTITDSLFRDNSWRYFYRYQCIITLRGCTFDRTAEGITCNGLDPGDSEFGVADLQTYDYTLYNSAPCEVNFVPQAPEKSLFSRVLSFFYNLF